MPFGASLDRVVAFDPAQASCCRGLVVPVVYPIRPADISAVRRVESTLSRAQIPHAGEPGIPLGVLHSAYETKLARRIVVLADVRARVDVRITKIPDTQMQQQGRG